MNNEHDLMLVLSDRKNKGDQDFMDIVTLLSVVASLITILGARGLHLILPKKYKDRVLVNSGDGPSIYLRYAIYIGGDVNAIDEHGWSALHHACFKGNLRAVNILVEADADINNVGDIERTPLMFALSKERWTKDKAEIVEKLLDLGADVNYGDYWNAMTYARRDSPEFVDRLKECGAHEYEF